MHLANILPQPVRLSQQVKIWTESSTLGTHWVQNQPIHHWKKKPYTHQQIMIMEGGDEDMEVDITM
jgi:hypothetical protein